MREHFSDKIVVPFGLYDDHGVLVAPEIEDELVRLGYTVCEDSGRGYRRTIPSPMPKEIVELDVIKTLVNSGAVVIHVSYTVRSTNNRYNQVYPFYATEGTEGGGAE